MDLDSEKQVDNQKQIDTDRQIERLLQYAADLWSAEETNGARFEARARTVQAISGALLAFLAIALLRGIEPVTQITVNSSALDRLGIGGAAGDSLASALTVALIATVFSSAIFSMLLMFAALANELMHAEDYMAFPPDRQAPKNVPPPRRNWMQLSLLYVIGDAFRVAWTVVFPVRRHEAVNYDHTKDAHRVGYARRGPEELLADYDVDEKWAICRPHIRRLDTASLLMQVRQQEAVAMRDFIAARSPLEAHAFMARYRAAAALRRWNQRKVDQLRRSQSFLAHGVILIGVSVVAYLNGALARVEGYPVLEMLFAGVMAFSIAGLYAKFWRSRFRRGFHKEIKRDYPRVNPGAVATDFAVKPGVESKIGDDVVGDSSVD